MPPRESNRVAEAAVVVSAETEKFERQIKDDLESDVVEAGSAAGQKFGEAFSAGAAGGRGGGPSGVEEALSGVSEKAGQAEKDLESTTDQLGETEQATLDLGESASIAGEGLLGMAMIMTKKVATGAAKATSFLLTLGLEGVERVGNATERAGVQLQESSEDMETFGGVTRTTGKILEKTGRTVEGLSRKLQKLKKALVVAVGAGLAESVRRADSFQEAFNKVLTVLPEGTTEIGRLRAELNEMAAETRQSAEAASNTLFKVLTRMPRLAEDTDKALEVVRTGLEAQSTGFVEATDAVAAYEAVLQGFQLEASDAAEVSDLLFLAQRRAGVEFDKIANSVGDVASVTNSLEGEFRDLLAIYATLVPTGQSVSEVNTQIRSVIQGIINPSEQAAEAQKELGLELDAQKVRSEGLLDVIKEVIEVTDGNPEVISRLFGRQEAITLLTTLAQRTEKLTKEQREFLDAAGESERVVDQMGESIGSEISDIGTDLASIARTIGGVLQPGVKAFFEVISFGTGVMRELNDEFFRWLQGIQDLEAEEPSVPFVESLDAINLQKLRAVREFQREVGLIDDERFRELERKFGESGRLSAQAFSEGFDSEEILGEAVFEAPAQRAIDEARSFIEEEATLSPEEIQERAREIRNRGRIRAMMARQAGEAEREVQRILDETQRKVNELVETNVERLQQGDATQEELKNVLDLWEEVESEIEDVFGITEATTKQIESLAQGISDSRDRGEELVNVAKGLRRAIERQRNQAPDLPEGVERMELGGIQERVRQAQRELEPLLMDLETNAADVLEVLDRWGISLEDIRDHGIATFADLSEEVLNLSEEEREARKEQEELVESFEKMAAVVSGITQAADAMGELDDETRAALQSVTALAQAGVQFAKGNFFAGAVQAGGALANIIGTLIQAESEREQVVEENTLALLRLRGDINALRKAMLGIPGDLLAVGERLNDLVQQIPENFGELSEHVLPEDRFFGTEDTDIFGEPEATGGEVEAFLDRLGITFAELETLAQQTGVSIENLAQAIEEGEAPADAVRQELIDLNEAMKELRLDRLFEGFEGQMSLLETRFDLLEDQFDSSAAKLEELRELFLDFVDLPGNLEEQIGGADLETPEGRRQFEEAIQRAFEMLASGDLEASDLGGLTPQQFQDMLTRLDDLVDQTEEDEGTTRAFQVSRQITETTATRLVGIWQTAVFVLRDISRSNRGIMNAVGGEMAGPIAGAGGVAGGRGRGGGGGTPNLPMNPPSPPPSGPNTLSVEVSGTEIDVDLADIENPGEFLDEIGRITGGEVDRALERAIEEQRRARGEVVEER